MTIYFKIEGKPVPKQSTRFTEFGAYTPKNVKEYAEKVKNCFLMNNPFWRICDIITNPVSVKINVFVSVPKKYNKTLKLRAIAGDLRPVTRPDVDNITKGILDALNGLVCVDDRHVYKLEIEKQFSETDFIKVEIVEFKEK